MNDESIFPFGPHKGKELIDVPDKYLLHIYQEEILDDELVEYIEDNMGAIINNIQEANERN